MTCTSSMILIIIVVAITVGLGTLILKAHTIIEENRQQVNNKHNSLHTKHQINIPFFFIPSATSNGIIAHKDPFRRLAVALQQYQHDVEKFIASMVLHLEIARKAEWVVFPQNADNLNNNSFSSKLEQRIRNIAELSELNFFALETMLRPFEFVMGLPCSQNHHNKSIDYTIYLSTHDKESSYDSAIQVLAHIVRDWSSLGTGIRKNLYDWIINELLLNQKLIGGFPSLVPGAGLGRLAFEISKAGFHVEANEISIVMSAAAHQLLHGLANGEMYPFVDDHQMNEVNTDYRYQKVQFPDEHTTASIHYFDKRKQSLSYTVGNFLDIYSTSEMRGKYGSVVTCFFIDTASNIYEYLLVIRNILMDGGIWINVGPLQWHGNSKLNPSGDELRVIIESMGFYVHSWEVDNEAINYRHDDMFEPPRYTKSEGYKPLRFVVSQPLCSALVKAETSVKYQIDMMRKSYSNQQKDEIPCNSQKINNSNIEELN